MTFGKLIDKIVGSWFVRKITSCGRSPRRCRSSRSPPARSSWAGWGSRCGSRGRSRRRTAAGRRSPRSRRGCTNQRRALGHVTSWGPMRTDLQVLHSMHCQGYFLTLIIMLGVNWRQVGWPDRPHSEQPISSSGWRDFLLKLESPRQKSQYPDGGAWQTFLP